MMFASDGNYEKAFADAISNSLKDRAENICDT